MQGSTSGLYADFIPVEVKKHATTLPPDAHFGVQSISFPDAEYGFVVGYYDVESAFSKKPMRDYFCLEIAPAMGPPDEAGLIKGPRETIYRVDLDWPADESTSFGRT